MLDRCECGGVLEKIWCEEAEYKTSQGSTWRTGRYRRACSHMTCTYCGKNVCVDDSFDGHWYNKTHKGGN